MRLRDNYTRTKPFANGEVRGRKIAFQIAVDPADYGELQLIAETEGRPLATIARRLLSKGIQQYLKTYGDE